MDLFMQFTAVLVTCSILLGGLVSSLIIFFVYGETLVNYYVLRPNSSQFSIYDTVTLEPPNAEETIGKKAG